MFSDNFKKEMVSKIISGDASVTEIGQAIGMKNPNPIYLWVKKFHKEGLVEKVFFEHESDFKKAKELTRQVGDLEKLIGQMHVKMSFLEGIIEESSSFYGEDLKMKFLKK